LVQLIDMSVILLVLGIAMFIGLIVIHEFGHFLAARRSGVDVEEFSIFFPPTIYKRKMKAGWTFKINALPLGGYVKLKGEHDTDTARGSFGAATIWNKTKIMVAGIVMNLLTAFVLLTILALIGLPSILPNQYTVKSDTKIARNETLISYVEPDSPASHAGLQARDELVSIGVPGVKSSTVTTAANLPRLTKLYANKEVDITYLRNGQQHQVETRLRSAAVVKASATSTMPKGYLGISPYDYTLRRSTWSAPIVAVGFSVQATVLTFQALGHALSGVGSIFAGTATGNSVARHNGQTAASSEVGGPVAIYQILHYESFLGIQFVLFIIAIISLTLGIMNLLPIPALDGGRLWITLVARALKRPLSAHTEEVVNATGFIVLIGLSLLIAFVDFHRNY
jgi:regulator of sigma E protease